MATRDPGLRRSSLATHRPLPTPFSMANSAIRRYHTVGPDEAMSYLESAVTTSAYWGSNGTAAARGWAAKIIECFGAYIDLASGDTRPRLKTAIHAELPVGADTLGVMVDVVLLDPDGYVARLALWDTHVPSGQEAGLLAFPLVMAVETEMGVGRAVGADVWHLRSRTQIFVSRTDALTRMVEVGEIIRRFGSA